MTDQPLPFPLVFSDNKIVIDRQIQDSMNSKLQSVAKQIQSEYERIHLANLSEDELWELAKIDAWNEGRTMELEGFEYSQELQAKAVLDGFEDMKMNLISLNFQRNMSEARRLRLELEEDAE